MISTQKSKIKITSLSFLLQSLSEQWNDTLYFFDGALKRRVSYTIILFYLLFVVSVKSFVQLLSKLDAKERKNKKNADRNWRFVALFKMRYRAKDAYDSFFFVGDFESSKRFSDFRCKRYMFIIYHLNILGRLFESFSGNK